MKIFLFLQFFVIGGMLASTQADFVSYHESFSPNKKYCAQFRRTDQDMTLLIRNEKTHKKEFSTSTLVPSVQFAQWSPDSRSLLVIASISGGTLGMLLHRSDKEWKLYSCNPPIRTTYKGSITGIRFLRDAVRFEHTLCPTTANGAILNFQLDSFNIDYNTGTTTFLKREKITLPEFESLNLKETTREKKSWSALEVTHFQDD